MWGDQRPIRQASITKRSCGPATGFVVTVEEGTLEGFGSAVLKQSTAGLRTDHIRRLGCPVLSNTPIEATSLRDLAGRRRHRASRARRRRPGSLVVEEA